MVDEPAKLHSASSQFQTVRLQLPASRARKGVVIEKWIDLFSKLNRVDHWVGNIQGFFQGMIGSEDLALAKHSILIITSGDLGTVFSQVTQDHQNHNWHQKLIEQHQKHQHQSNHQSPSRGLEKQTRAVFGLWIWGLVRLRSPWVHCVDCNGSDIQDIYYLKIFHFW